MNKKYILVSTSSSFFMRSRCKYCKSGPVYSYADSGWLKPSSQKEMAQEFEFSLYFLKGNRAKIYSPIYFSVNKNSFNLSFNKISLSQHVTSSWVDNSQMFLCSCGDTCWFYSCNENMVSKLKKSVMLFPSKLNYDWIF